MDIMKAIYAFRRIYDRLDNIADIITDMAMDNTTDIEGG